MIFGQESQVVKTYNTYLPEELVAILGGLLLFFLPVDRKKGKVTLSWKEGVEGIEDFITKVDVLSKESDAHITFLVSSDEAELPSGLKAVCEEI